MDLKRAPIYAYRKGKNAYYYATAGKEEIYAESYSHLYSEVKALQEALSGRSFKRSIETGCGYGRLTPWIAEHTSDHVGIDHNQDFVEEARRLYPSATFEKADVSTVPYDDRYFDLNVSWGVLSNIPPSDLSKTLSEMVRVTAPDGIIVIQDSMGSGQKTKTRWAHSVELYQTELSDLELVDNFEVNYTYPTDLPEFDRRVLAFQRG